MVRKSTSAVSVKVVPETPDKGELSLYILQVKQVRGNIFPGGMGEGWDSLGQIVNEVTIGYDIIYRPILTFKTAEEVLNLVSGEYPPGSYRIVCSQTLHTAINPARPSGDLNEFEASAVQHVRLLLLDELKTSEKPLAYFLQQFAVACFWDGMRLIERETVKPPENNDNPPAAAERETT